MQRLQKHMAALGVASRRKCEELIAEGRVLVNGEVATIGCSVGESDTILFDGKPLQAEPEKFYLMLHKPRGFVTTMQDEQGRRTVAELVSDVPARVYPVGRLDLNSEGLLLMTNDGALANALMHPRGEVGKTYLAWVQGYSEERFAALCAPMELDGYALRPVDITRLWSKDNGAAQLRVTIYEGRNRQIRRMCEQCSLRVTRLKRIRVGDLALGDLEGGSWRHLTDTEVNYLKTLPGGA